jgi:hypothetical protein
MKVHDLWSQFNQALKNYEEITEDRKRTFDELKDKDEKSADEIDKQMRKIQMLTVILFLYFFFFQFRINFQVNFLLFEYFKIKKDNIGIQKSKIQLNIRESQDLNDSIKNVKLKITQDLI